jgi:putative transposase
MKKSRFTEQQIIYALRQVEAGTPPADVCRQRMQYGNLGLTELKELRQLRDENARLKRLVADLTLDKHILGEVVRKKCMTRPVFARELLWRERLVGLPKCIRPTCGALLGSWPRWKSAHVWPTRLTPVFSDRFFRSGLDVWVDRTAILVKSSAEPGGRSQLEARVYVQPATAADERYTPVHGCRGSGVSNTNVLRGSVVRT